MFDSLTKLSKICLSVVYHILYQKNKHLFENSNLNAKANTSDLANYVPKSNVVFESGVSKVRFGTASGVMNIDLYGGATTFYRLALDNNSKKISFWVFDGTSLNLLFEK